MMETGKFIKLVRERRCLYRKKNDFISRHKVAETWLEIARLMGTGNGKQWATKWKGLRDCYKKFKKAREDKDPGEACRKYKNWPWAKHMKFLDHETMKQSTNNMDNENKVENTDDKTSQDSEDDTFSHSDSVDNNIYPQNAACNTNYSCPPGTSNSAHFEDSCEIPFETVMVMNNANNQRNKLCAHEGDSDAKRMFKYLQENVRDSKTMDDIDQLFASYATSLKKMPARIQSMIKLDIATLFAKYEFEVQDQSCINIKCERVESIE